ncbi:MAG TPA: hypothetical protein VNN79_21860 [Actinomycetota bacterium]|nr:hypothetical protein [Actinomycetota bacterium]
MTTRRRSTRRRSRMLTVAAVAALIAAGVIARASGEPGPAPPAQRQVVGSSLGGVDCAGTACMAVGTTGSVYGVEVPLAVSSDGGAWVSRPPVGPSQIGNSALTAVSCATPDSCVAVGREELPTPFFGSRAAGDRPLAESWDGNRWRRLAAAAPSGDVAEAGLNGVDCAGTSCMAVGDLGTRSGRDRAIAESWDGRRWTLRPPAVIRPTEDLALKDVACTSASSCVAVGHFSDDSLFLGTAPLIQRWNGTEWAPDRSANAGNSTDTELAAVDCPSATACVAVGYRRLPGGRYGSFAESWDGTGWKVLPTRDPAGSPDTELAGVACPTPGTCLAVGTAVQRGTVAAFAESWDETRWTIESPPVPSGSTASALSSVACPGSTPQACRAVGIVWHGSPVGQALTVVRRGTNWSISALPTTPPEPAGEGATPNAEGPVSNRPIFPSERRFV